MVAAGGALRERHAAEFRRPDHQRVLKQAPRFRSCKQRGDRPIDLRAMEGNSLWMSAWLSQLFVGPPMPLQTCTKRTPRSSSRRAVRQLRPKSAVAWSSGAVELVGRFRLFGQVEHFRGAELHLGGQLIGGDARLQTRVAGVCGAGARG